MRIAIVYNTWHAGGCEMRAAEICQVLREQGDEVFLVGTALTVEGAEVLRRYQLGAECMHIVGAGDNHRQLLYDCVAGLRPDVVDVQWVCSAPEFPFPTVATGHGDIPLPEAGRFHGYITVESFEPEYAGNSIAPVYAEIWNWVDCGKFAFNEELGDGWCFFGRLFKADNLRAVWDRYGGRIHIYGMRYPEDSWIDQVPPNVRWMGLGNPIETMRQYRVVFGSARVALEALASGRFVLAGQPWTGWIPETRLVQPHLLPEMSARQFATRARVGTPNLAPEPWADSIIAELLSTFCENLAMRQACRTYIEDQHEMRKQIGKIRRVYEQVIEVGNV